MNAGAPLGGSARSVVREIDQELNRLEKWQKAAASEQRLLLSARAVLAEQREAFTRRRRRVSQAEVSAYLAEHPGAVPGEIAQALQAPTTSVSSHLYRGQGRRYERRDGGWHLLSPNDER